MLQLRYLSLVSHAPVTHAPRGLLRANDTG